MNSIRKFCPKKQEEIPQRADTGPERCIWLVRWSVCLHLLGAGVGDLVKTHIPSRKHVIGNIFIWQWSRAHCQCSESRPGQKNTQWEIISHGLASPEPRPQHYWSGVGSSWQIMEHKASNIQRWALNVLQDLKPKELIPEDHLKKWPESLHSGCVEEQRWW